MTLEAKIDSISKTSNVVTLPNGKASDYDELWTNIIEPNLPKYETIKGWHNILIKYIKEDFNVFPLRIFGSYVGKNKDEHNLRRGFYNETNLNFDTFYVDNFFTSYFCAMAIDNYVPSYEEFKKSLINRTFPCGYLQTTTEIKKAAFKKGKDPRIQYKGYKIAHIFDAGQKFNSSNNVNTIGKFCSKFFPRGSYDNWKVNKSGFNSRLINIDNKDKGFVKQFLIAHFLRIVHPINYFLVPKDGCISFSLNGITKDKIGEEPTLIAYVSTKIKALYKDVYEDYLKYILPLPDIMIGKNITINASYSIKKVSKPIKKTDPENLGRKKSDKFVPIYFNPSNIDVFKNDLLKTKKAIITWVYSDGTSISTTWDAINFSKSSSVSANIRSKSRFRRRDIDGLVIVKADIVF